MQSAEHDDLPLRQNAAQLPGAVRMLYVSILAVLAIFVTYTALRGISESWDNEDFPEALAVKLELLPTIFPLHMIAGGLALLVVPLVLLLRKTPWHKSAGRLAAAIIVVGAVTAIPVALEMPVTRLSAAGFVAQASVWLALLATGIWHIRHGNIAAHRQAMLLMAAVTTGAVFFRIFLGLWKIWGWRGGFEAFYACDAWIAWMLPLGLMAATLKISRRSLPV